MLLCEIKFTIFFINKKFFLLLCSMEDILKIVKKHKINNIEITLMDLFGNIKQTIIPSSQLKNAIKYGLKCDGSNINCDNDTSNSDTRLFVDTNSYFLLPNNKLMLFCFTDNKYDARKNLSDIQNQITEKNLKINFGAEVEFFLFKTKNGKIDIKNIANNCYFQQIDGIYRKCLEDISNFCKGKIILEAIHHECGINQFEIDFKYDNPLQTADNIIFLKNVIRYFAEKYELKSCFMPKPLNNASGSGMHINMSVFSDNENLFYDKNDVNHLSNFAYRFITNIFKHISAITALTNPNVNSYKRLNSGFETPTSVEYSAKNRSV